MLLLCFEDCVFCPLFLPSCNTQLYIGFGGLNSLEIDVRPQGFTSFRSRIFLFDCKLCTVINAPTRSNAYMN